MVLASSCRLLSGLMGADFLLLSIPARSTRLSFIRRSAPPAIISFTWIVKMPCPRDERAFIAIGAICPAAVGGATRARRG